MRKSAAYYIRKKLASAFMAVHKHTQHYGVSWMLGVEDSTMAKSGDIHRHVWEMAQPRPLEMSVADPEGGFVHVLVILCNMVWDTPRLNVMVR